MILDLALFKVFVAKMALDAAILRSRLSVAPQVMELWKRLLGDDEFVVVANVFADFQFGIMNGLADRAAMKGLGDFGFGIRVGIRGKNLSR